MGYRMAKKTVSRLDSLQEGLSNLKKTLDIRSKSEKSKRKRSKKAKKRKLKKKKHMKESARKKTMKKTKRDKQRALREKKRKLKRRKLKKHKERKMAIRKKKKILKLRRSRRREIKKEVEEPKPEEPKTQPLKAETPKIEAPKEEAREEPEEKIEEETEEEAEEKADEEPQAEEAEEIEEVEETEEEEEEEEMKKKKKKEERPVKENVEKEEEKKGGFALPFKVRINLPGRKKKRKGAEAAKILMPDVKKKLTKKMDMIKDTRSEMIKQLIVADVMSTDPITIKPTDKVSYVVRLFSTKKISGAPVVVDHNIVGIVTKSDIIKVIGVKDIFELDSKGIKELEDHKISDVMRKKVHYVKRYTKISEAADIMNKNDINLLPVVDELLHGH